MISGQLSSGMLLTMLPVGLGASHRGTRATRRRRELALSRRLKMLASFRCVAVLPLALAYPPPPFLQPPPPYLPPAEPPPPNIPPPPFPPGHPPPPAPTYPPQARIGDLYGGYRTLDDLLAELTHYGVHLDPDACNSWESATYLSWFLISLVLSGLGIYLHRRNRSSHVLFRMTMVRPSMLYAWVMLGFTGSCGNSGKTQEPSFCLALLSIEPLLILYFLWLLCDARRHGLNAHTFDVPLRKAEWRWLLFSLFYHILLLALAAFLLVNLNANGRLLLAAQAAFTLRYVRPPPTVCPEGEQQIVSYLLLACAVLSIGGHLSVKRLAPAYLGTWTLAATGPLALQALLILISLLTCLDTQFTQEAFFFPALASSSGLALLSCAWMVGGREAVMRPTRWVYTALLPYHLVTGVACLICMLHPQPLMAQPFMEVWMTLPQPPSARYIFFLLILLLLLAIWSVILFDRDESEPPSIDSRDPAAAAALLQQQQQQLLYGGRAGTAKLNRRQRLVAAVRRAACAPLSAASKVTSKVRSVAAAASERAAAGGRRRSSRCPRATSCTSGASAATSAANKAAIQAAIEAAAVGIGVLPPASAAPAPTASVAVGAGVGDGAVAGAPISLSAAVARARAGGPAAASAPGAAGLPASVAAIVNRVAKAHTAEAEALREMSRSEQLAVSGGESSSFVNRDAARAAISAAEAQAAGRPKIDEFTSFRSRSFARAKEKRSTNKGADPTLAMVQLRESRRAPESSFVRKRTDGAEAPAAAPL